MTIAAVRLNHAVLFVSDLARSVQFWTDAFGMQVVVREPRANAAFLRLPGSGNHHDLGLFGLGAGAAPKHAGGVGLYHLAWQVDTVEELEEARRTLQRLDAYTGESSHGATKSMYGADPDGTSSRDVDAAARGLGHLRGHRARGRARPRRGVTPVARHRHRRSTDNRAGRDPVVSDPSEEVIGGSGKDLRPLRSVHRPGRVNTRGLGRISVRPGRAAAAPAPRVVRE